MGIPSATLNWMHNGQLLTNSIDSISITATSGPVNDTSTLQWMNVPFEANGEFTCVASDSLATKGLIISVQILSKFVHSTFNCVGGLNAL